MTISRRERKRRKKATVRVVVRAVKGDLDSGKVESARELQGSILRAVSIAATRQKGNLRNPARIAAKAIRPSIALAERSLYNSVREQAPEIVAEQADIRTEFETRLEELWRQGFGLAELCRVLCLEAGMDFHDEHRSSGSYVHSALSKMHARGCLIASEVLTLLRAGYASGAHARWRALHELAVMSGFIAQGGEDLAERYLLYEHVESLKAAREYQTYAVDLEYEPLSDEEFEELKSNVDELCERFGPLYKKDYGWAAATFGFAPNFRNIEERSDLSHYRPYYRMASHPIHAGPKGILFNIGLHDQSGPVMLAGTSTLGMTDPGHGLCISLSQITSAFILSRDPDAGSVVVLGVIKTIAQLCGRAFLKTQKELEDERSVEAARMERVFPLQGDSS